MFKYIHLADTLKRTIQTKSQLKPQLYSRATQVSSENAKVDPRVAYSNLSLIINNIYKFEQFYQELSKVLRKRKQPNISNKYLLFVMVAEYLNVGNIKGGGKLKAIVMQHLHILPHLDLQSKINKTVVHIRVRRNCPNLEELRKWDEIFAKYEANQTIPHLYNLSQGQYSQLVINQPSLRTTPACVVQSFSSSLPPFVLFNGLDTQANQTRVFDVIDACAAPGNKTMQLAQYLGQRGTVFAFEKDERRYHSLVKNVEKFGAPNINCIFSSFLDASPKEFGKVKLIMLDPSCSGSGMLVNFTRDAEIKNENKEVENSLSFQEYVEQSYSLLSESERERIGLLKQFQLELLDHASLFRPQRISYSTCSIFEQENEEVVVQFLGKHPDYELKAAMKRLKEYPCMVKGFGQKCTECIRVDPRSKVSDGFFVALFARRKLHSTIH